MLTHACTYAYMHTCALMLSHACTHARTYAYGCMPMSELCEDWQALSSQLAAATGSHSADLLPRQLGRHLAAASLAQGDTKTAEAALQTSLTDVSSADLGSWTEDLLMLAESHHLSIASSKGNAAQNVPVSASRCHSVSAQNYQPSV